MIWKTDTSVHICRYYLQVDPNGEIDWSAADHYYSLAIKVYPEGGASCLTTAVLTNWLINVTYCG